MIYDIRVNKEEEITEIQFDDWEDNLIKDNKCLQMNYSSYGVMELVSWKDFDNFIAACHKAKELWGPKE